MAQSLSWVRWRREARSVWKGGQREGGNEYLRPSTKRREGKMEGRRAGGRVGRRERKREDRRNRPHLSHSIPSTSGPRALGCYWWHSGPLSIRRWEAWCKRWRRRRPVERGKEGGREGRKEDGGERRVKWASSYGSNDQTKTQGTQTRRISGRR